MSDDQNSPLNGNAEDTAKSCGELLSTSHHCELTRRGELEVIEVSGTGFTAAIALQGAQLLEFTVGEQPWIWLSEEATYESGQSVRGGIPVCWPWFGAADKNPAEVQQLITADNPAAHGFARSQLWSLSELEESSDLTRLVFVLSAPASDQWSGAATLSLEVTLSAKALELKLTTLAHTPINICQALHSYFATSDISCTYVSGLQNVSFYDALDNWAKQTETTALRFSAETDRVYDTAPPSVTLQTPEHALNLSSNSSSLVVWNPWIEKAKRLSQFDEQAYQRMFCVETANLLSDAVSLLSGESHTLSMRLSQVN